MSFTVLISMKRTVIQQNCMQIFGIEFYPDLVDKCGKFEWKLISAISVV